MQVDFHHPLAAASFLPAQRIISPDPIFACSFLACPNAPQVALQVGIGQPSVAHDATLGAGLQILIAMHWHDRPSSGGRMSINVVAAVDTRQGPPALFKNAAHPLSGDHFHSDSPAASRTRPSSWATASHPSAASRRLVRISSSVSPCVWQPGSDGMEAE